MEFYDWQQIKDRGDCIAYCLQELGLKASGPVSVKGWQHFERPPWRPGSDSGGFACGKDGWKDHARSETGSIIDLVARAQFDNDIFQAQNHLGKYLGLEPKMKVEKARKLIKVYDYRDPETGFVLHQTCRYEPKQFRQRRPDPENPGKHIWNLEGITPVLYRISDWQNSRWVCVVGGEKDADALLDLGVPATTNPMGEGNWRKEFDAWFVGKDIVLIPDNDDKGRNHVQTIAASCKKEARAIKIVELPDLPDKGDTSDWLAVGGDAKKLWDLIAATKTLDTAMIKPPSEAKQANETPFSNYRWGRKATSAGEKTKPGQVPIHINELVDDVFLRFKGFPRRVGATMFDDDEDTGKIRQIKSVDALFAWIAEKSKQRIEWSFRLGGAVTRAELFASLYARCKEYQMISPVPTWPLRDDVYYTFRELPPPTPDGRYFDDFCMLFAPASGEDMELLRVFVASPLYYHPKVDRPMWIIDSEHGQGVGKTKLVEMVAFLYGGTDIESSEPFWVDYKLINNESSLYQIFRRLLSHNGRQKRIFLLDNVDGYFKSSALATLVTQGSISGLAPYGTSEETRTNDLTYVITSNSATVSRDLASRSIFINLMKPEEPAKLWENHVQEYIQSYRLNIISDIMAKLDQGAPFEFTPVTRFKVWEQEVLVPIMERREIYHQCGKSNHDRQVSADGEMDEAETIQQHFREQIDTRTSLNPDTCCLWIESKVISEWCSDAIPGFGGKTGRNSRHKLCNMIKAGMIQELSAPIRRYPLSGGRGKSGLAWNWHLHDEAEKTGCFRILAKEPDGQLKLKDE